MIPIAILCVTIIIILCMNAIMLQKLQKQIAVSVESCEKCLKRIYLKLGMDTPEEIERAKLEIITKMIELDTDEINRETKVLNYLTEVVDTLKQHS
jgi:hypothetical protein